MPIKTFSLKGFFFLSLSLLALSMPGIVTAAPEQRTALVIGNSSYNTGSLRNPVNDADDMASALKRLGFDVILKKNAAQQDMEDAIRNFGDRLKKGGVGLFFYAGHGVQISGKNFLLPIGVKIDQEPKGGKAGAPPLALPSRAHAEMVSHWRDKTFTGRCRCQNRKKPRTLYKLD